MSGPLYSPDMDATRAEGRDGRIDELHAEAKAAVGYAADSVRQIADRYRLRPARGAHPAASPQRRPACRRAADAASGADGSTSPEDAAAVAAEAGAEDGRRRAILVDADNLTDRRRPAPGRAQPARRRAAQPRADLALPRARRRHPDQRHGRRGQLDRAEHAHRRGPGIRAAPAGPRGPRRPGPGAVERDLPDRLRRPGGLRGSDRGCPRARPARRAAAPRAGRRARLHQPAPPAAARRAGSRWLDRRCPRDVHLADRDPGGERPPGHAASGSASPTRPSPCGSSRRRSRTSASTRPPGPSRSRPASRDPTGSSKCAMTAGASISARWPPADGVTSGCNSCASEPS